MSDWISREAGKKRRKEEKKRQKEEKQSAKEARRKHYEEEVRAAKQRWFEQNEVGVTSTYQLIETHMKRVEDAGFQVSLNRSGDGCELSIYYGKDRRIDIAPNYDDGFEVIFTIKRYYSGGDFSSAISHKTKRNSCVSSHQAQKKRSYTFDGIPEKKILSWIKWVATGKRPFWLV